MRFLTKHLWALSKMDAARARSPRSFVVRSGRTTPAQQRAISALWPRYGAAVAALHAPQSLFARPQAPLTLEIGFGNGENLLSLAVANPDNNFIGIEVYPPGIGRTLRCCSELELDNVRIVHGDAEDAVALLPAASIDDILILFPDPWPKRRHNKRRLLKEEFIAQLAHRLKPGGWLHIASDCEAYARDIEAGAGGIAALRKDGDGGLFCAAPSWYRPSKFDRRAQQPVLHLRYQNKP